MVGLSRSKFNYCVELSQQMNSPSFTMSLPDQKLPEALDGDEGDFGLSMDSYAAMRAGTKPGPELDEMNRVVIQEIAKSLDLLQPAKGEPRKIRMYSWPRDSITTAKTRSVYGPMNPYDDEAVADAFCLGNSKATLVDIDSGRYSSFNYYTTTCRGSKQDLQSLRSIPRSWGSRKSISPESETIGTYQAEINHNVPLEYIARYEVGGSIAVLVNTTPSAFWTLLLLHSQPSLLDDIGKKIDACIEQNGAAVKTLDTTSLKKNCPLLLSSYQEVLGYLGTVLWEHPCARCRVASSIKVPAFGVPTSLHSIPEDFYLKRSNIAHVMSASARLGVARLCPGQRFATNEVLAIVAAFIAAFIARLDMEPVEGNWRLPSTANTNAAAVIMEPDDDIEVDIKRRQGFENVKLVINLNKPEKIFVIVIEDNVGTE